MNEQKENSKSSIEWTRVHGRKGYTWNPVQGCQHDCKWIVGGNIAECYAKTIAQKFQTDKFMSHGFEHHYFHPDRLQEPLKVKEPAGIFLDSLSDLMGAWVPTEHIQQVLNVCAQAHWHTFQLLTKNAPRLLKFQFPHNVWVGISSPPDWMMGKQLDRRQQERMLHRSLETLHNLHTLGKASVTWMSFEPLSWDVSEIVAAFPDALQWAVIGAASNGNRYYPPEEQHAQNLLHVLDRQGVKVFFKGNLKSLKYAAMHWRAEFPTTANTEAKPVERSEREQMVLFDMYPAAQEVGTPKYQQRVEAEREYLKYIQGKPNTYRPAKDKA